MRDTPSLARTRAMLVTALGDEIVAALDDPAVVEIMINPDGKLWVERQGSGRIETGLMPPADTERVIRLVASHMGRRADAASPIVSAELPMGGERFEGLLPPVSPGPCFSIRKPAGRVISLDTYVSSGVMAAHHAEALRRAVLERENILVVGGTGSGKTTLANALLAEITRTGDRLVILEDTRELVSAAADSVQLRTQPGSVSLADLVRSTLRLRPDRIIIGEVRGAEALDMLKAWNTGHPGGIATLHANSALGGLSRLEQLIGEASAQVPHDLIAETIDCVVYISRRSGRHRVETVARMNGLGRGGYDLSPVQPDLQLVLPSLPFSEPLLSTAPERTPPQ
ncbi:P-type conjugative transfer ATPase TrbB [Hyphomonas sp.]|uniref:P-type conjugative transfer ATPase TrbB n=1 Tax=Hyphomonas sp. TaxID=87 RepID=UPI003528B49B